MAVIGTFQHYKGRYLGSVRTLTIDAKVEIVPSELTGEREPQHLVMAGTAQVGAGWNRTTGDGREYISIKLDDPSLPAPIFANLVPKGDLHHLIWARPDRTKPQ
jgi:uncharacterized protein (DUF736 family)